MSSLREMVDSGSAKIHAGGPGSGRHKEVADVAIANGYTDRGYLGNHSAKDPTKMYTRTNEKSAGGEHQLEVHEKTGQWTHAFVRDPGHNDSFRYSETHGKGEASLKNHMDLVHGK